jgi:alkyl sulfatase BDS1-like metallo-beta-lactamase superfamily hydrolase
MTHISSYLPASFDGADDAVEVGPRGQLAHRRQFLQTQRFDPQLHVVAPGVWCMVGNGLSNQTFVEAPDGIIAIDTGECTEEMAAALAALRDHTDRPIAAVIYTHFHYVGGTMAIDAGAHVDGYPIWGHERIVANRGRLVTGAGTTMTRGAVHQLGVLLPSEGADGLVGVGIGRSYQNPAHAPFTPGFTPPTHTIGDDTTATTAATTTTLIAGIEAQLTPAPSDADDSLTIWFPTLGLCVNNLLWPSLFNIYAIRGEEYRDPRVLVRGIDHVRGLRPEHLIGTHGPPISGHDEIERHATLARDAIQFIWDQTVRGMNHDLTAGELIEFVQLPNCYDESYVTQQTYGLVEHHTRQVHTGLRGWFDGYEADLFPLPTAERCRRLVAGFGGAEVVRAQAHAAIADDELRWGLELATWLVRSQVGPDGRADGGDPADRALLAAVLRAIAQRTPAANIRNWCLTRARELDGLLDLNYFRTRSMSRAAVLDAPPSVFVHDLAVSLVPSRAADIDIHVAWQFDDGTRCGLHIRHCVAAPTDGAGAQHTLRISHVVWAAVLGGRRLLADVVTAGEAKVDGDHEAVLHALSLFEVFQPVAPAGLKAIG